MGRSKELAKNTIIIAIGKVCTQVISFFMLPIYTDILSTSDYGIVDLLNTYITLLIPIISLQMDQGIFRFLISSKSKDDECCTITCGFFLALIQSLFYALVFSFVQIFIENSYKWFLLINVIVTIFSNLLLQISRGFKDNVTYATASALAGAGMVFLNVVFIVAFRFGATGMFLATLMGNMLCVSYIFFKKKIYLYIQIRKLKWIKVKDIIRYSYPLVPSALSWWVIDASDRTIVSHVLGVSKNGILSIAHKIPSVLTTFYNIFNIAWIEFVITHFEDEENEVFFREIINSLFSLVAGITLGVLAIIPFIFSYLINDKFADAYFQIPILLIAFLCTAVTNIYTSFYICKKETKKIASTAMISGIINVIVHILLIGYIGLYAATISSAVAYGIMMIIRYRDCIKIKEARLNTKLVMAVVMVWVMDLIAYYLCIIELQIIALLVTMTFVVLINKKTIQEMVKIVMRRER